MRGTRRSRQEREALVAQLEQSKMALAAFAREHGIPESSLHTWRSKLRRRPEPEVQVAAAQSAKVAFVEVMATEPTRAEQYTQAEAWIDLDGRSVLHLRHLPEASYLARLVRTLCG